MTCPAAPPSGLPRHPAWRPTSSRLASHVIPANAGISAPVRRPAGYDPAMATLVLTVIGDDRAGLVNALADVVTAHGGNWERSQLAELAGKFAGIVQVSVADERADELAAALEPHHPQKRPLNVVVLKRWAAGSRSIPPWVWTALAEIGDDRRSEIGIAMMRVRTMIDSGGQAY